MGKHYAVIENMTIPAEHRLLINDLAYVFDRNGYRFRGTFQGPIELYIIEALMRDDQKNYPAEVFHDGRPLMDSFNASYTRVDMFPNWEEAFAMAKRLHPLGDDCPRSELADQVLMVYKLFGVDLKSPVSKVFAYVVPEGNANILGLVQEIRRQGALVVNLYDTETRYKVEDFLSGKLIFD